VCEFIEGHGVGPAAAAREALVVVVSNSTKTNREIMNYILYIRSLKLEVSEKLTQG
jgi:hypothetical protein